MSVLTSGGSGQVTYEDAAARPTAAGSAQLADLTRTYGDLSGDVRVLREDVDNGRRNVRVIDLADRTTRKAQCDVQTLLRELAVERGIGWSDMARLLGVSVGAIRKWRNGEGATPDNRRAVAKLAAFLDVVESAELVEEPAGWLLMRLIDGHTVTAADLYAGGHEVDLLEHLLMHLTTEQLLDRWDPDWRSVARSDWKIVDGPDGERVLVRRD